MTDDDITEGWYTDSEGTIRWWDGAQWTEHVQDAADVPEPTVILPADRSDAKTKRPESGSEDEDGGRRRRTWLVATFVGLLTFFLGMAIAGGGNSADPPVVDEATASSGATSADLDQREADLKKREEDVAAKQQDLDQREQDVSSREDELRNSPSGTTPEGAIENGVFEVGADVEPGTYMSEGPDDPELPCSYKVSSDEAGDEIISSKISQGPGTVTLEDGQFFTSEYCKPWTLG